MDDAFKVRAFLVLFLSVFIAMLGLGIILPILPIYAKSIGVNGLWIGALFACFSLSRSLFMPLIGKLSDKQGRKAFITCGLFVYSLSSLGYVFLNNAQSLFLIRIIQGACSALIVPIAMAYIGDIAPCKKEGRYLGLFNVALYFGFGLGPLLGGCIQAYFGINAAFILMGLLCGIASFFVLLYLPSSLPTQKLKDGLPSSYRTILASRYIKGIFCYRFVNSFVRAAVLTFLPLYASCNLKLSVYQIGMIISVGVLLTSLLQYPFGKLADTLDRKSLIIIGNILYCLTVMHFPSAHNFSHLMILSILMGITGAISLPAATALVVQEGRQYGMGKTIAISNLAMSIGLGVGPIVSGIIYDFQSLSSVFYFAAIFGIILTLVAGYMMIVPSQLLRIQLSHGLWSTYLRLKNVCLVQTTK